MAWDSRDWRRRNFSVREVWREVKWESRSDQENCECPKPTSRSCAVAMTPEVSVDFSLKLSRSSVWIE